MKYLRAQGWICDWFLALSQAGCDELHGNSSTKFTPVQRQSKNFWVVFLLFTAAPNVQFLKSHHKEIEKKTSWSSAEMFLRKCENVLWKKWGFFYSDLQGQWLIFFCLLPLSSWKHKYVVQVTKVVLYTLRGEKIKGI